MITENHGNHQALAGHSGDIDVIVKSSRPSQCVARAFTVATEYASTNLAGGGVTHTPPPAVCCYRPSVAPLDVGIDRAYGFVGDDFQLAGLQPIAKHEHFLRLEFAHWSTGEWIGDQAVQPCRSLVGAVQAEPVEGIVLKKKDYHM